MAAKNAVHMTQINASIQIALGKRLTACFELLKRNEDQNQKRRFNQLCKEPDHADTFASECGDHEKFQKGYSGEDQSCLPIQVQMLRAVGKTVSDGPQHAEQKTQAEINNGIFPERAGFKAR